MSRLSEGERSALVSVIFGYIPARRATLVGPMRALALGMTIRIKNSM